MSATAVALTTVAVNAGIWLAKTGVKLGTDAYKTFAPASLTNKIINIAGKNFGFLGKIGAFLAAPIAVDKARTLLIDGPADVIATGVGAAATMVGQRVLNKDKKAETKEQLAKEWETKRKHLLDKLDDSKVVSVDQLKKAFIAAKKKK